MESSLRPTSGRNADRNPGDNKKNPVIPAEAFLEKVSLDRDSFQLEKFRKAIRDRLAPLPVTQPPPPPLPPPPVTPQATEVDAVVAPEVSAPPPPNSTYFKRIVLGATLEEMVNGMPTAEFQTVMGKIEKKERERKKERGRERKREGKKTLGEGGER